MVKVLLFAPEWVDIIAPFKKNLEYCGFEVSTLNTNVPPFRYKNFLQKLKNFLRKAFLRDFNFKEKLKKEHYIRHRYQLLDLSHNYDYAFVVRADSLSKDELAFMRKISKKMVSYHFDGLERTPEIFDRIPFFDQFFVFEPTDVKKYSQYKLKFITNFYFDYSDFADDSDNRSPYELYYMGTFNSSRIKEIVGLRDFLFKEGINHRIELVFDKKDLHHLTGDLNAKLTCLTCGITFEEYLQRVEKAKILLDFLLDRHTGLSFRTFESIKYDKKLITTNQSIVKYDFYHPNNVFILKDNYEDLIDFLGKPYIQLSNEIKKKYSFTNWINNIFEREPFYNISADLSTIEAYKPLTASNHFPQKHKWSNHKHSA